MKARPGGPRWNENLHHHPLLVDAVPAGARRVLDVGCGEGMLAREVAAARPGAHVVGIDLDGPSVELARATPAEGLDVDWVLGDVLTGDAGEPGTYDAVLSVCFVHHVGTEAGLRRCAELVRPGGIVAAVGVATRRLPRDLPAAMVNLALATAAKVVKPYWMHSAPIVWPPDVGFAEMPALAARVLPGCAYRQHVLGRWSIVWTKPAG